MLETALRLGPQSAAWVDEHYEEIVALLGRTNASQLVGFSEEPPNKLLFGNTAGVSLRAGNKRRRSDKHLSPITPLPLSRMLSTELFAFRDMDTVLWRIRDSYNDAALAPSGMWKKLSDPSEARTDAEATV